MKDVNDLQPKNALFPINVMMDDMIFTVFKFEHPLNASLLISVTLDGIVMDVNDEHPSNAAVPIEVTEDAMVIDVRLLKLRKALSPIDVISDDDISTVFTYE